MPGTRVTQQSVGILTAYSNAYKCNIFIYRYGTGEIDDVEILHTLSRPQKHRRYHGHGKFKS